MISSKPFEAVVDALKTAVGRPDMVEFASAIKVAWTLRRTGKRRDLTAFIEIIACNKKLESPHHIDALSVLNHPS
jgi:hypothetical protein